jgi:putative lipoic acid-binding regulatory protein
MTDSEDKPEHRPSPIDFPCEFVIKIFGATTPEFEEQIKTIIRKHDPELASVSITTRPSKDGKYIALSVSVHVENQTELDQIYYNLTGHPLVLMAL